MKKLVAGAMLGSLALGLAACGSSDDASTEAMPDTVEMPAEEALEPITEEPVEDSEALGPPADASERAPSMQTAEEAADAAESVAAEAAAAAEAAEAAAAAADLEVE
jgi:hypothetical protein